MTHIKAIDPSEAQGTVKKVYDEVQKKAGAVPTFLRVMGLRPDILESAWTLGNRLMDEPHALSQMTKSLIASHVSKINSAEYCMVANIGKAIHQGFTEDEVRSILNDVKGSKLIDDCQKAILHFAEKMTRSADKITESDIQVLRDNGLTDAAILETTCIIGWYNMMNRLVTALGVPVEELYDIFFKKT
jgi:uncharacterized peroxidase-related enzyme